MVDAHAYLLKNFEKFDFIWSSPPCPSHSKFRKGFSCSMGAKPIYPDMKLYEEILLLKHYFIGKWCIENVIGFYEPLIKPCELQRHYFWVNFHITQREFNADKFGPAGGINETHKEQVKRLQKKHGFDLSRYKIDKETTLRNCVNSNLGLHILNESKRSEHQELFR